MSSTYRSHDFGGVCAACVGWSSTSSMYIVGDNGTHRASHCAAVNLFVNYVLVGEVTVGKCEL